MTKVLFSEMNRKKNRSNLGTGGRTRGFALFPRRTQSKPLTKP
jgi:hypothetical protein